jgi:hypothetical protein
VVSRRIPQPVVAPPPYLRLLGHSHRRRGQEEPGLPTGHGRRTRPRTILRRALRVRGARPEARSGTEKPTPHLRGGAVGNVKAKPTAARPSSTAPRRAAPPDAPASRRPAPPIGRAPRFRGRSGTTSARGPSTSRRGAPSAPAARPGSIATAPATGRRRPRSGPETTSRTGRP